MAENPYSLPDLATVCELAGCAYWEPAPSRYTQTGNRTSLPSSSTFACLPKAYANATNETVSGLDDLLAGFDLATVGNCSSSSFYAAALTSLGEQTTFVECDTPALQQLAFYRIELKECTYDPVNAVATQTDPLYAAYYDASSICAQYMRSFKCDYDAQDESWSPKEMPYFVADLGLAAEVAAQPFYSTLPSGAARAAADCAPGWRARGLLVVLALALQRLLAARQACALA